MFIQNYAMPWVQKEAKETFDETGAQEGMEALMKSLANGESLEHAAEDEFARQNFREDSDFTYDPM